MCNLNMKDHLILFETPLVVDDIGRPEGKIEVTNEGTEPSFDAKLIIKSEALTKEESIKGCKSLSQKPEQVR